MLDGAGFVNTDPPEDPNSIVGVAGIEARDDGLTARRGVHQIRISPLGNDLLPEGSESLHIKSVSATRAGATVTITEDGKHLLYTAGEGGFGGYDNWYYIVETDDGKLGKANVTVRSQAEKSTTTGYSTNRTSEVSFYVLEDSPGQTLPVLGKERVNLGYTIIEVTSASQGIVRIADDGRSLWYRPNIGAQNYDSFEYKVERTDGRFYNALVRIHIAKPIQPITWPAELDYGVGVSETHSLFTVRASTPEPPQVEILSADEYAGQFVVAPDSRSVTFTPNDDFAGTAEMRYQVRYGPADYQVVTGTRGFHVLKSTLIVDNYFNVKLDSGETQLDVLANDYSWHNRIHKSPLDFTIAEASIGSSGGTIRVSDDGKTLYYQPAEGFVGEETFTHTVRASNGLTETAEVTVSVASLVNDSSGVPRFATDGELQQFLLDRAPRQFRWQFGTTVDRYAPGFEEQYRSLVYMYALDDMDGDGSTSSYSETNTQVAGVDEADIVETDGRYVYTFTDGKLLIVDLADPSDPQLVSYTAFEGRFDQMYLQGDRMTLIRNGSRYQYGEASHAGILVLDVSDRSQPRVLERTEIEGHISDSRAIGDRVHLVVRSNFKLPQLGGRWLIEPELPELEQQANRTAANRARAVDADVDDDSVYVFDYLENNEYLSRSFGTPGVWKNETFDEYVERVTDELIPTGLTSYRTYDGDGKLIVEGQFNTATEVHKPLAGEDVITTLVTFDAGDDAAGLVGTPSSFVSDYRTEVYMSSTSAYVFMSRGQQMTIYKLDLQADGSMPVVATGSIDGRLLNQYSIDEYDGKLRVATTETIFSTDPVRRRATFNNVLILEQVGNQLHTIGEITNLAPTETIHSVRFMGEEAFVVTFRRVDPLFAIDLSDPTQPSVEGALKIPGFSNYLHPVAEGFIVGIGRDANEITGRLGDLQITLFDVRDLSDPKVADQVTLEGTSHVDSEAWRDHLAVSFFAEGGVLALPINWTETIELTGEEAEKYGRYRYENHSAIWTFEIDTADTENATITATGKVEHEAANNRYRWPTQPIGWGVTNVWRGNLYDPGSPARRALRIGESLITVSNDFIKVHDLTDPSQEQGEIYLGELTENDSYTVREDRRVSLDLLENDHLSSNGERLTIDSITQPTRGGEVQVSRNGRRVIFTPTDNYTGYVNFTYTAIDEVRGEQTATVSLYVENTPDKPTANDDVFSINPDTQGTLINVRANDVNPDASIQIPYAISIIDCDCAYASLNDFAWNPHYNKRLTITKLSTPDQGGSVELDPYGQLRYTPAEGFVGYETFRYTIQTQYGRRDTATVTIVVGDAAGTVAAIPDAEPELNRRGRPTMRSVSVSTSANDRSDLLLASELANVTDYLAQDEYSKVFDDLTSEDPENVVEDSLAIGLAGRGIDRVFE